MLMKSGVMKLALVALTLTLFMPPVQAQNAAPAAPVKAPAKAAVQTAVKIGYFNLNLVKISYPEAAGSEALRAQAECQLRKDVEDANKRISKAQEEKKAPEELQKMAKEVQAEINAKQQALAQLVQSAQSQATEKLYTAVNMVAKEKGLDVIVDGAGVFAGGKMVLENGQDVTLDIITKLSPASALLRPASASK